MGVIYQIINTTNNKKYVGSTNNFLQRKNAHINNLTKNKHTNYLLQEDWNKYGNQSFEFKILETVSILLDLKKREQSWIDILSTYNKGVGYNISKFACMVEMTTEVKLKISAANKGKDNHWLGRKHNQSSKLKIAAYRLGKKWSVETKEKMSISHQKRFPV